MDGKEKPINYFYENIGFKLAEDGVQKCIEDNFNEGCKLMYCSASELI